VGGRDKWDVLAVVVEDIATEGLFECKRGSDHGEVIVASAPVRQPWKEQAETNVRALDDRPASRWAMSSDARTTCITAPKHRGDDGWKQKQK
jgi:hypothetical protein